MDSDAQLRGKMVNVERRAQRQASRFPDLNMGAMQKEVNRNLLKLPLHFEEHYMGLPDLMNFLKNGRQIPTINPETASNYYLFANGLSLNGLFFYQFLTNEGYDPLIVQNYSLADMEHILDERPLAVCISSTFLYLDDIKRMAKRIKDYDPGIPVIVGGILVKKIMDAGAEAAPQTLEWLTSFKGAVDVFVIETHGEETLLKILQSIGETSDLHKIPNLGLFDKHGELLFTQRVPEPVNLDRTAIVWDQIPREYLRPTLSIITSQGCSYRCRFCTYHRWFPRVHYKSLDALHDELQRIERLGFVKHVRFADDNFTANKKRMAAVLKMMIQEKFTFTWSAFARAGSITPEISELMRASGCEFINMGIESGSPQILKNMDKKMDPKQALEAIRSLKEQGIHTLGGFIIGYPGETRETFNETIDLINQSGLNYYHPYLFYYSKSMLVHQDRDRFKIEGVGWTWRHHTMDSVTASELMSQMIEFLPHAFTDGQQKTWETFKLLRGEGYSIKEIHALHHLKRKLQLILDADEGNSKRRQAFDPILNELDAIMKGH